MPFIRLFLCLVFCFGFSFDFSTSFSFSGYGSSVGSGSLVFLYFNSYASHLCFELSANVCSNGSIGKGSSGISMGAASY